MNNNLRVTVQDGHWRQLEKPIDVEETPKTMWPKSEKERRPESELLALCIQSDWRKNLPRIGELVKGDIDWPSFAELTRDNRVSGLLAPVFNELEREGVLTAKATEGVKHNAFLATATALHFQSILEDFLSLLEDKDLPVIVLKGLALSHMLYEEPLARPCGDLDILIHPEDYARLHEILVAAGYEALDEKELPKHSSDLETTFEQHFLAPGGGVQIEVHTDSIKLGVKPAGAEAVWDRAVPVKIGNSTALSMCPRDLALMLPIHLHRHGFIRLLWFKDIDLLVRTQGDKIDWDLVIQDARDEGATSSLWLTLTYMQKLLDTPVPEHVLKQTRPKLAMRLMWRMLWTENRVLNLDGITRRRMVQFAVDESWRGTIPSLLLMGRRTEKLKIMFSRLIRRKKKAQVGSTGARISN